jgi:hypothetical protein
MNGAYMNIEDKKKKIVNEINDFIKVYQRYPSKNEYNNRDDLPHQNTVLRIIGTHSEYQSKGIINPSPNPIPKPSHYCIACGIELLNNSNKFCNRSCAASFNNKKRDMACNTRGTCKQCFATLRNRAGKWYCSKSCHHEYRFLELIDNWIIDGNTTGDPITLKKMITRLHGYSCANATCQLSDWDGKSIVLQLEHKDGNSENNSVTNLCLLCPNCHSQTSTFTGKNRGNGRHVRRQRYKDGKSY